MTSLEILTLAADADAYDAVVVLWVTSRGTQPVLLPRSLAALAPRSSADPRTQPETLRQLARLARSNRPMSSRS